MGWLLEVADNVWFSRGRTVATPGMLTAQMAGDHRSHAPTSDGAEGHYATILRGGTHVPATVEDVETLFAPATAALVECRAASWRLTEASEVAFELGLTNNIELVAAEDALAQIRAAQVIAEDLILRVFFSRDVDAVRWLCFVESIHEVDTEIEQAVTSLRYIRDNMHRRN